MEEKRQRSLYQYRELGGGDTGPEKNRKYANAYKALWFTVNAKFYAPFLTPDKIEYNLISCFFFFFTFLQLFEN